MTEKLLVLQSNTSETTFWVPTSDPETFQPVEQIEALTPFGMLLAGLGASTATVLHTFARDHGLDLQHVELLLQCGRPRPQTEESYGENGKGREQIEEEIVLYGTLSPAEHEKLLGIARQCAINQTLERGLEINPLLAQDLPAGE